MAKTQLLPQVKTDTQTITHNERSALDVLGAMGSHNRGASQTGGSDFR